jgi:hypothetical protein
MATKNVELGMNLDLPKDTYRWNADRGRYEIHYTVFVPDKNNPRDKLGNEPAKLRKLMGSIKSDQCGGIHLSISGYIENDKFHIIEGHRRYFASKAIIEQSKAGNTDDDTTQFEWLPVSIEKPQEELDVLVRMQSSDSLKEKWTFKKSLDHARKIFEVYRKKHGKKIDVEEVPEDLAAAMGWNIDKLKAMIHISQSPTLTNAVDEYDSCTYKGWLYVVRNATILMSKYTFAMESLTGKKHTAPKDFKEAIYALLVKKVDYYAHHTNKGREGTRSAQPGSLLERCGPVLRRDNFPHDRAVKWLTTDIDLTPNGIERMTQAGKREEEAKAFIDNYDPKLSDNQLQAIMNGTTATRPPSEASSRRQAQSAPAASAMVESSGSRKVTASADVAPAISLKPAKDDITITIKLPKKKEQTFEAVVEEVAKLLHTLEIERHFSPLQKSLVGSALVMLDQGRAKSKSG